VLWNVNNSLVDSLGRGTLPDNRKMKKSINKPLLETFQMTSTLNCLSLSLNQLLLLLPLDESRKDSNEKFAVNVGIVE